MSFKDLKTCTTLFIWGNNKVMSTGEKQLVAKNTHQKKDKSGSLYKSVKNI